MITAAVLGCNSTVFRWCCSLRFGHKVLFRIANLYGDTCETIRWVSVEYQISRKCSLLLHLRNTALQKNKTENENHITLYKWTYSRNSAAVPLIIWIYGSQAGYCVHVNTFLPKCWISFCGLLASTHIQSTATSVLVLG